MTKIEAIEYLVLHSEYKDEWSGAGMWEAVEEVMKQQDKDITTQYLNELLKKAYNF